MTTVIQGMTIKGKKLQLLIFIFLLNILTINIVSAQYPAGSPVAVNGKLSVIGSKMVNECGNPVQLRGMSTHGLQWFNQCVTPSSIQALAKDWNADILRAAMYIQEGGYVTNPSYYKTVIDKIVDECGKQGIYVVIDFHVHRPGDPMAYINEAKEFWGYMSVKHAGKKHVIYEICNEPSGVDWPRIKQYANDIIPRIRANDPNTIIVVGTPSWSQLVNVAADDRLNFPNIMYAFHFYGGTHGEYQRNNANYAIAKGLPLMVTE